VGQTCLHAVRRGRWTERRKCFPQAGCWAGRTDATSLLRPVDRGQRRHQKLGVSQTVEILVQRIGLKAICRLPGSDVAGRQGDMSCLLCLWQFENISPTSCCGRVLLSIEVMQPRKEPLRNRQPERNSTLSQKRVLTASGPLSESALSGARDGNQDREFSAECEPCMVASPHRPCRVGRHFHHDRRLSSTPTHPQVFALLPKFDHFVVTPHQTTRRLTSISTRFLVSTICYIPEQDRPKFSSLLPLNPSLAAIFPITHHQIASIKTAKSRCAQCSLPSHPRVQCEVARSRLIPACAQKNKSSSSQFDRLTCPPQRPGRDHKATHPALDARAVARSRGFCQSRSHFSDSRFHPKRHPEHGSPKAPGPSSDR